ncbi:MAG: polysaccharide biosynthesis protein [Clostridia bacterium]|nr:polysaccharide biosynthesis protein [Clostridia bacterium]
MSRKFLNLKICKKFGLKHWQLITLCLVLYDVVAVSAAYFLALWLRFDCRFSEISKYYLDAYIKFIPIYAVVCIIVFWWCRLYRSIWRFASYNELMRIITATIITFTVHILGITLIFQRMPISYYALGIVFQFMFTLGIRFAYRFTLLLRNMSLRLRGDIDSKRVMIIGAGAAGQTILRDIIKSSETNDKVLCIIDDNPNKWNRYIEGVPIVGGRNDILYNVKKYNIDKILLAIPSACAEDKRDILNICSETGCELKNLPGIYQFVTGEVSIKNMKDVSVEDLLGRDQIKVNLDEVFNFISGKTVLVTGGGGSIGSELCRQIAAHNPKQLIIFDIYENNAYDIQLELKDKHPELNLVTLIGSVRDSIKINDVFKEYKPDIVYHAAAHKHVPLMEDSPCEAIKNNAVGTYKTAYAAMLNGCKRFVLISTDKAVNPTNIMGASKRICEMIIQSFDKKIRQGKASELPRMFMHATADANELSDIQFDNIETEFVAVRFGNVLGSNGSVIPLFKRQIEKGGPVTVTHPDIIRYFMTIPEAVSLVLQAGVYAKGGEIFVLDMGTPVKIDTLARNLIRLSGFKPDVDIKIEYTGLRPGEKLYEEKLMSEEGIKKTPNDLIFIGKPVDFNVDYFLKQLADLMMAAYENRKDIGVLVEQAVPTYKPTN